VWNTRRRRARRYIVERDDEASYPALTRAICTVAVTALLSVAGCVHRPAGLDPSPTSATLSCRQIDPPDARRPEWITPADPDMSARLSKWCATVGPVYFVAAPRAVALQPIDRLAIVSWNIHEGGGDVEELIRRLRLGEFTEGVPIGQFVLLLQEALRRDSRIPSSIPSGYPAPRRIEGPSGSAGGVVQRLAREGLAVLYAPSMRNGVNGEIAEDRGNAIVSTLVLHEPTLIELPLERQRRVAIVSGVEGESQSGRRWRLGLVDVHLDTALALFHGGPFDARRRQAAALIDALRSLADLNSADGAAVVAGDFNAWRGRGEPAVKILREEFPDPIDSTDAPTWTGPLGLHARLDQILVRGLMKRSRVVRLPSRFGSDHYPILTVVEF
jgi:endonuclease/exonuclease/phosphatase family metal-dependent hydrolase